MALNRYVLKEILDPQTPYVLCWDHNVGDYSWRKFHLPLIDPLEPITTLSRLANFDFVLQTEEFIEILPLMKPAIKAVQLSTVPPDYLDMRQIQGEQL